MAAARLRPVPPSERLLKDVQVVPQAAEQAAEDAATAPQVVIKTLPGELAPLEACVEANVPIEKTMPLVDVLYGVAFSSCP